MDTAHIAAFADGEYTFFLPMARLIAAEREMDCSVFELFDGLGQHLGRALDETVLAGPSPARLRQCHSLIRNALIGGGTSEIEAKQLVETYCYPARAAIQDLALTFAVLRKMVYGVDLGSKKKSDPAGDVSPSDSAKGPSSSTATGSA